MLRHQPVHRSARPAIAAMLTAVVTSLAYSSASADVITSFYNSDEHFSYQILHMPDVDQRRQGLAGNGAMHCVPAACANLILYAANHGFDDLGPGPANYQSQGMHAPVTNMVMQLGNLMNTTFVPGNPNTNPPTPASGGTNADSADLGLAQWLAGTGYFSISSVLSSPQFTLEPDFIAKSLIAGSIGTMSYGRYAQIDTVGDIPVLQRQGGHATTIVRAYRNGDDIHIWVRDPGSNDALTTQSPFANRIFQVTPMQAYIINNNNPQQADLRTMYLLDDGSDTGNLTRLMDGYRALRPKAGFSFEPTSNSLAIVMPEPLDPNPGPQVLAPDFDVILDTTFHPQLQDFLILAGGESLSLHRFNPLTSESEPLPVPVEPRAVGTAGNGWIYITTQDHLLHRLTPELQIDATITLPTQADQPPAESLSLNYEKIKFTYELRGFGLSSVVVANMLDRKVMFIAPDLSSIQTYELPSQLRGNLRGMAVEPGTTRVWFALDNSDLLHGIVWDDMGAAQVETIGQVAIGSPTGLDFDDEGNLLICTGGKVVVLQRGRDGSWGTNEDSAFHGVECLGMLSMMHNTSNYDPAYHDHPAWSTNIDPDELIVGDVVPDCQADLAVDGTVNADDLLQLLAAWGWCEQCAADLTGDGTVGVPDLLNLLAAWGECP